MFDPGCRGGRLKKLISLFLRAMEVEPLEEWEWSRDFLNCTGTRSFARQGELRALRARKKGKILV